MWSFNDLLKLFILSQDFIFSFKLFHTLTPILDKQYSLLVVRVYICLKQTNKAKNWEKAGMMHFVDQRGL